MIRTAIRCWAAALGLGLLQQSAAAQVTIHRSVEVRFATEVGISYQVQQSGDGETWHNFGMPIPGDDSTKSVHFPTTGSPRQLFRVEEIASPSVIHIDLLSYFNPFGVREYDHYEDGSVPRIDWYVRSLGTASKNGTPVIVLQEYDPGGFENDRDFILTDLSESVSEIGSFNNGEGDWFWQTPVPLLLRSFVPAQDYWLIGLERTDFPDTKIDYAIRMERESVVVPAGSFDCIKVTRTFVIPPPSPMAGTYYFRTWYAEHVGLVKRIQEDGTLWELTRFEAYTPCLDPAI